MGCSGQSAPARHCLHIREREFETESMEYTLCRWEIDAIRNDPDAMRRPAIYSRCSLLTTELDVLIYHTRTCIEHGWVDESSVGDKKSPFLAPTKRRLVRLGYGAERRIAPWCLYSEEWRCNGFQRWVPGSFAVSAPGVGYPQGERQGRCEIDGCQRWRRWSVILWAR